MRVLYHARNRVAEDVERESGATWATLPDLLAAADFVTLHVSLGAETRHLIDARALATMRPSAILVNTARGPVVDTDALVVALRTGGIQPRRWTSPTPSPCRRTTRCWASTTAWWSPRRLGDPGDARPDGGDVGRQPARRGARRAAADAGQSRGVRPARLTGRRAGLGAGPRATRTIVRPRAGSA